MMNKLHQCKLMLFTCMLMSGTAYAGYGESYLAKSAENTPINTTSKSSVNRLSVKDNVNILLETKTNKNTSKLATVCFITDTNDCQGQGFIAPGGDIPEWYPDPEKRCDNEGYLLSYCQPLYEPYNYCPYDENYWEKCVCKTEFKETCLPPYSGIGSACEGKYERCCKNDCPSGYDTSSGTCRQASSQKTECGNACYKIVDSTCKSGSLNAPSETGGYKNKIVGYTDCGAPCWQSYDDNCPSGSVKAKVAGKCYDTAVTYTPFGSACYKEKACCDDICILGSLTRPAETGGYRNKAVATTGCGNTCWQSFSDNCPNSTDIKNPQSPRPSGTCYGKVTNTAYGSTCVERANCCAQAKKDNSVICCNDIPVAVIIPGSNLAISLSPIGVSKSWDEANNAAKNYKFCEGSYGRLPTFDETWYIHQHNYEMELQYSLLKITFFNTHYPSPYSLQFGLDHAAWTSTLFTENGYLYSKTLLGHTPAVDDGSIYRKNLGIRPVMDL